MASYWLVIVSLLSMDPILFRTYQDLSPLDLYNNIMVRGPPKVGVATMSHPPFSNPGSAPVTGRV